MIDVLRWGRTAYETDDALAMERRGAEALGLTWALAPAFSPPEALDEARALVIPSKVRIDRTALSRFRGELIVATTSGHDHVDLAACGAQGVAVARLPGARRDAVVEHALASLIGLSRRGPVLAARAGAGAWARGELAALAPRGISGSRILVIGLGVIGQRMADVVSSLGGEVLGFDPLAAPGGPPLDDLLACADAITLHCALTPSSRGLLSASALDRLAPHAVVVNTARGEVLDVEAAVERVREGRLRGLACDVFPVEPYPGLAEGAAVPGVWFSPHSAGYTHDLGERVARGVVDVLSAWVRGAPLPDRLV